MLSTIFFNDGRAFASSFLTGFELTKEERKALVKDGLWPDQLLILKDAAKNAKFKPSLGLWVIGFETSAFSNIFHGEVIRGVDYKTISNKNSAPPIEEERLLETWKESVKIVLNKWLRARRLIIDL